MGGDQMVFLFGLASVHAVVYRLAENVLFLGYLLIPQVRSSPSAWPGTSDELPRACLAGFPDVLAAMTVVIWLAARAPERKRQRPTTRGRSLTTAASRGHPEGLAKASLLSHDEDRALRQVQHAM